MNSFLDLPTKTLLKNADDIFWAGALPPLSSMQSSNDIYDPNKDYRLASNFHQQFDLVYLVEKNLGSLKAWPLIMDEAMRLLKPQGTLIVRMSNTHHLTVFALKNQMNAWGKFLMLFEHIHVDGSLVFAVKNMNNSLRNTNAHEYSFGVVINGENMGKLETFISSVSNIRLAAQDKVEILVCGPASAQEEVEAKFKNITYIQQPNEFSTHGWLTKKKNLLTQHSSFENIVIAHDRYTIQPDFIEKIKEFGSDYSVLVPRQTYPDGRRIPDWVTLGSAWSFTRPAMIQYGDWSRHLFVNGGIMVAKKHVLTEIPWNELLFWFQAEDVEISRRFIANGYIPRMARHVTTQTTALREGYIEGYEALPMTPELYMITGPEHAHSEFVVKPLTDNKVYLLDAASIQETQNNGVYIDNEWQIEPAGIKLNANTYAEITFRLPCIPRNDTAMRIEGENLDHSEMKVIANDIPLKFTISKGNSALIILTPNVFSIAHIVHIQLIAKSDITIFSIKINLQKDDKQLQAPKRIYLDRIKNKLRREINKHPFIKKQLKRCLNLASRIARKRGIK